MTRGYSVLVSLPHHRLVVWHRAFELTQLVGSMAISGAENRGEARRAVKACLRNIAEAAGRTSRADKSRVFGIARGECIECVSTIETACALGECSVADMQRVVLLGGRVAAMLSRLIK